MTVIEGLLRGLAILYFENNIQNDIGFIDPNLVDIFLAQNIPIYSGAIPTQLEQIIEPESLINYDKVRRFFFK